MKFNLEYDEIELLYTLLLSAADSELLNKEVLEGLQAKLRMADAKRASPERVLH